ncbi:toast rack family protein [Sporosarcina sp. A2]|uniref:toast rack family protein n=1 Tax=Sporosarcina sp. A2 TaxID=3393449 RepID=UPI003D7A0FE4
MKKFLWTGLIVGMLVTLCIFAYEWVIAISKEEEITIERDKAKSLAVTINFDAGDLVLQGGSTNWLDAKFDAKKKRFLPNVKYDNKKDMGVLTVKQKSTIFGFNRSKRSNRWDIQLNNAIPIDLDVAMGVSKSILDLKGIQLNKLTIAGGVGDSTIDFGNEWKNDLQAEISIGVGKMTLLLPKQTGVKLIIDRGLGELEMKDFIPLGNNVYVNEAYENNETSIEMDVNIGIGNLNVELVE